MTTDGADQVQSPPTPQRVAFATADGLDLRGELSLPAHPTLLAVLCHPHPLHGGNMNALVIDQMFQELPAAGVGCLRFNFRGVMGSEGVHGYGDGEQLDLAAAIETLRATAPGVPVMLAGWSFGADVCLTNVDEDVAGWFLIAPPLRSVPADEMRAASDHRPKLLVVPANDQFNPPAAAAATTKSWETTSIEVVEGTDHFLNGKVYAVSRLATAFAQFLQGA